MTRSARDGAGERLRDEIVDGLRRYGTDAGRLAHAFGSRHDLQPVDVEALVAVMGAENAGEPLTPGRLRAHLGLSSGGTSYVIDRLERAGHLRRVRDHPTDSRVVHLRHTEQGVRTGSAFFGPLGEMADGIMADMSERDLRAVARFLGRMADGVHDHLAAMDGEPRVSS